MNSSIDKRSKTTKNSVEFDDDNRQLFRAINAPYSIKQYIVYYLISILSIGALTSWYDFNLKKERISKIKIGNIVCELDAGSMDYFFQVYLRKLIFGIATFGLYNLFGFATQLENEWFDKHLKFSVVSKL